MCYGLDLHDCGILRTGFKLNIFENDTIIILM